jgi:guanylate kinase
LNIKYQNRPIIIAICGKSATGKDTLAKQIVNTFKWENIPVRMIVSDTTRPPRPSETKNIDYHFITTETFHRKKNESRYLEWAYFNGWFYGTDKTQVLSNCVNVGIFSPEGIEKLSKNQNRFEIFCVYLNCSLLKRLFRSYKREGRFKKEYLRRAYTDKYDFKNIQNSLKSFQDIFIFDTSQMPSILIAQRLLWRLKMKGLY